MSTGNRRREEKNLGKDRERLDQQKGNKERDSLGIKGVPRDGLREILKASEGQKLCGRRVRTGCLG